MQVDCTSKAHYPLMITQWVVPRNKHINQLPILIIIWNAMSAKTSIIIECELKIAGASFNLKFNNTLLVLSKNWIRSHVPSLVHTMDLAQHMFTQVLILPSKESETRLVCSKLLASCQFRTSTVQHSFRATRLYPLCLVILSIGSLAQEQSCVLIAAPHPCCPCSSP